MYNIAIKGRSHFLLRKTNSNVNRDELLDESKEEEIKESQKDTEILYLQKEILDLKDEMQRNKEVYETNDKYADLLNDLFHKGIIDSDGNFIDKYK